jgi:hypothetical protein
LSERREADIIFNHDGVVAFGMVYWEAIQPGELISVLAEFKRDMMNGFSREKVLKLPRPNL